MFLGEYQTKFTGHGRILLPKKFRQELSGEGSIILSRGFEGCIWGFSPGEWKREAEKQLAEPVTDKRARDLRRYLFSGAESITLDEQGRFVIPPSLLQYGALRDEVVIIGAGDHFEVWDIKLWENQLKELTKKRNRNMISFMSFIQSLFRFWLSPVR